MKFSILSAFLIFASSALADTKYFSSPFKGSVFSPGEVITFVASDIENEKDVQLTITLNDERGNYYLDLGQFRGDQADEDAFVFTWQATAPPGNYFVEILQHETDNNDDDDDKDKDGEKSDGEGEEDDDDDKIRSYVFTISNGQYQAPSPPQYYGQYSQGPVAPAPAAAPASYNQPSGQNFGSSVYSYLPLVNAYPQSEDRSVQKASNDKKKVEKREAKQYHRRSVLQKRSTL